MGVRVTGRTGTRVTMGRVCHVGRTIIWVNVKVRVSEQHESTGSL